MGYSSQQAIAEDIRYDVQRQLSDDAFTELEAIYIICAMRATDDAEALAAIRKRAAAILRRRDEEASQELTALKRRFTERRDQLSK
jgi:hypothetical protein